MKRTLLTATAALMLVGPFAGIASAQDGWRQNQGQYQSGRDGDGDARDARRGDDNGYRHDGRHRWRDDRRDARWDQRQHNGYYDQGRWHYGPPPQDRYGRASFQLGYQPWARGQRLGYYANRYQEVDYRHERLRAPRRGYHWVRDDRGDYLLAAIAGGLIAQVILNGARR